MPMRRAILVLSLAAGPLMAQTEYHELESGSPLTIEDALAIPRQAIDLQLAPVDWRQMSTMMDAAQMGGVPW